MMMMMMIIMQLVRQTPDERALKVHNTGLENRFKLRSVTFTVLAYIDIYLMYFHS